MSKWEPNALNISDTDSSDMSCCDFDRIESYDGEERLLTQK